MNKGDIVMIIDTHKGTYSRVAEILDYDVEEKKYLVKFLLPSVWGLIGWYKKFEMMEYQDNIECNNFIENILASLERWKKNF